MSTTLTIESTAYLSAGHRVRETRLVERPATELDVNTTNCLSAIFCGSKPETTKEKVALVALYTLTGAGVGALGGGVIGGPVGAGVGASVGAVIGGAAGVCRIL